MSQVLSELKYTKTHEWVRLEEDGTITVGISDHAQALLGELVYVELPDEGVGFKAGEELAVVESVKAASDVYAPMTGEVLSVNTMLKEKPELINEDCYGGGWLFTMQPEDEAEMDDLLDADAYSDLQDE